MSKTRLEAFSDAVIAVIMTILVLELKPPGLPSLEALWELGHPLLAYAISFITLAVYWNNHHHLFQAVKKVTGKILWWNMALLFFISLFPFATSWVGEFMSSRAAQLTYGGIVLITDVIWIFLADELTDIHQETDTLNKALRGSRKSFITISLILFGMIFGWFYPPAVLFSVLLSLIPWIITDQNIETLLNEEEQL
jgi:uncharacterized membrane protein